MHRCKLLIWTIYINIKIQLHHPTRDEAEYIGTEDDTEGGTEDSFTYPSEQYIFDTVFGTAFDITEDEAREQIYIYIWRVHFEPY